MIKRFIAILISLILILGLSVCAFATEIGEETFVYDEANLLDSYEEADLSELLREISHANNVQIAVATVDSTGGKSITAYINDFYDDNDLGYGETHDGILLLICMVSREYRILSNGSAADVITMDVIDYISDSIVSDLSDGYYYDAFARFADECDSYYRFDLPEHLKVSLIIGVVAGFIVVFVLKAQLKSVKKRYTAREYIRPGSLNVRRVGDFFLYSTVSKTRRQQSSSSGSGGGSGGGSRNVGGGRF